MTKLNFSDTSITFTSKSDKELSQMNWLFMMFSKPFLVRFGSAMALKLNQWGLPLGWAIRNNIFKHFCGGETLSECGVTLKKLLQYRVSAVLDYGVEAKDNESAYDQTLHEILNTINFAATQPLHRIVSIKITGIGSFALLEKCDKNENLSQVEEAAYNRILQRLKSICEKALENKVQVYIDAEESWIQDTIDSMVENAMRLFNKNQCVVFQTIQCYRHDRLKYVENLLQDAKEKHYVLGLKLVRGAYIEKENKRAEAMGYPTPLNPNKEASDEMFNHVLHVCIKNIPLVHCCCASHNVESTHLAIELAKQYNVPCNSHHLHFSQLYGMSDNLTFHLAHAGYNVSKYLPFGPVNEVLPYLIRRAQENSSVAGQMGREWKMIRDEIKRRKN